MRENGLMVSEMEWEPSRGLMAQNIKAFGKVEKLMAKEN